VPVVRQSEEAAEPCADLAKAKEACLAEVSKTTLVTKKNDCKLNFKFQLLIDLLKYFFLFYSVFICREVTAQNW
jgi:hypothetical protein